MYMFISSATQTLTMNLWEQPCYPQHAGPPEGGGKGERGSAWRRKPPPPQPMLFITPIHHLPCTFKAVRAEWHLWSQGNTAGEQRAAHVPVGPPCVCGSGTPSACSQVCLAGTLSPACQVICCVLHLILVSGGPWPAANYPSTQPLTRFPLSHEM